MHSTAIRASKSSTKGAKLRRAAGKKDSDEVTGRPVTSPMLLTSGLQMQAEERSRRIWSGKARLEKAPVGNHAYSCLFALAQLLHDRSHLQKRMSRNLVWQSQAEGGAHSARHLQRASICNLNHLRSADKLEVLMRAQNH